MLSCVKMVYKEIYIFRSRAIWTEPAYLKWTNIKTACKSHQPRHTSDTQFGTRIVTVVVLKQWQYALCYWKSFILFVKCPTTWKSSGWKFSSEIKTFLVATLCTVYANINPHNFCRCVTGALKLPDVWTIQHVGLGLVYIIRDQTENDYSSTVLRCFVYFFDFGN
jgi:hypothetical protein